MRPTLVIVDDHAAFRRLAGRMLQAEGFDVVGEADLRRSRRSLAFTQMSCSWMRFSPILTGSRWRRLTDDPFRPRVVLTSSREAAEFGDRIMTSSADGFVHKNDLSGESLARAAGVTG
jgi:DNA-binding NarL/FixJ family response regulator